MKVKTERIIFEVPVHLKRAFAGILAGKGMTQAEVLRRFVEAYVKRSNKSV